MGAGMTRHEKDWGQKPEPHNNRAEVCVLGAILADNAVFDRVAGSLKAADFHVPVHAETFAAITDLRERGRRADVVTLAPALQGKESLGGIDLYEYIRSLREDAPKTADELFEYVREVRYYAGQRGLQHVGRELVAKLEQRQQAG